MNRFAIDPKVCFCLYGLATVIVLFAATESFAGCNPRTQDIADCFAVPAADKRTVLSTAEEIFKIKERFENIEAVKLTKEFHERFDKFDEAVEKFEELYSKALDAETGRDPWKIEKSPEWLADPLGRLVFEYNAKYEGVARSIEEFTLPSDIFVFRSDLASYPTFSADWNSCQIKAADALTYDLGRIEIMLTELSDQEAQLDNKSDELNELKRVWSTFIIPTYLNPDLKENPLLDGAAFVGLFFNIDPSTMAAFAFAAQNEAKSEIANGSLPRIGRAIADKKNAIDAARRQLLVVRTSLSLTMTSFQKKCAPANRQAPDITGVGKDTKLPETATGSKKISHPKGF